MPIYVYKNKLTEEIWEELHSYSTHVSYLEENLDIEQVFTPLNLVTTISGVTNKRDAGFTEVMQRIAAANPYSPVAKEYGSKGIKESKVRDVVEKHREIQSKT